jgi:hypothetical protein
MRGYLPRLIRPTSPLFSLFSSNLLFIPEDQVWFGGTVFYLSSAQQDCEHTLSYVNWIAETALVSFACCSPIPRAELLRRDHDV